MADDIDLEILQERLKRQRMGELLSQQQQNPNGDIALNLAGGFLQNLSNANNANANVARVATGKDPIQYSGAVNVADQAQALNRQKQLERRRQALEDIDLVDRFAQRKKASEDSALKQKQALAMAGYSLGDDSMPVIIPGGSADTEKRYKEAQMKKLEADAKRPAGGVNAYGSDKDLRNLEIKLRGEYEGRDITKETQKVATAYQKVAAAAKNPSAAGDLSLIFGYMKMLDPGSTVREGEFANAQNAAGISDQVRNMYNRAASGERLNPNQRADFIGQAKNIFNAQLNTQKQIDDRYNLLASQYGVNPKNVVSSYDFSIPDTVTAKSAAPSQGSLTPEEVAEKEALKKELGL